MKRIGAIAAALVVAATLGMGSRAEAGIIQLGFILDGSGSIGAGNWATITAGLADAVNTYIPVTGADQYSISVVSFGSSATTNYSNFLVTDATARQNLANGIAALPYLNGSSTNFAAAFSQMQLAFGPIAGTAYVNFATDGQQNTGGSGVAERNSLIAAGVDNISIEGIGSGVDATDLRNNFCYPQSCDATSPYNFPTQGFYIGVADAQEYADAIGNKIQVVVNPIPEPTTMFLLGTGFLGLATRMRRRKQ